MTFDKFDQNFDAMLENLSESAEKKDYFNRTSPSQEASVSSEVVTAEVESETVSSTDEPKSTKRITFEIDTDMKKEFQRALLENDLTMTGVLTTLINNWLQELKK